MLHAPRDVQLHALYHGTGGGGSNIFLGVSLPFLCSVLGFQFLYGSKPGFFPEMEGYTAPPL